MDGKALPISSSDLYARLGTAAAPLLLDVRRDEAFSQDGGLIISALRRSPGDVARWSKDLLAGRPVVAYCVHGHEVSQGVAAQPAVRPASTPPISKAASPAGRSGACRRARSSAPSKPSG